VEQVLTQLTAAPAQTISRAVQGTTQLLVAMVLTTSSLMTSLLVASM